MSPRTAIWCIAIAETIVWAGLYYAFPALLVRWESAFGWTKPELTGAVAVAIAASAVVAPLSGAIIDRGHGALLLTASALFGGLLMALLSSVDQLWQFYALWAGLGVAMGGCLYEPCFVFLTRTRGEGATHAITLVSLFAGFAGTLSFPLGHIVSEAADWRMACLVYAGLIVFVAVPRMWLGTRTLEPRKAGTVGAPVGSSVKMSRNGHFRKPAFWLLALGFSLLAINHGVVLNHLLPLLDERGIDAATAVLTVSMIGPMQVVGRLAMMVAQRHVSTAAIMAACFVGITVAAACLIGASAAPWLLVGFVVLHGAGFGVMSIVKPAITRETLGQTNFGAIAGAMAVPYLLAIALAPFLGSLIWLAGGYQFVLPTVLACAALGGISAALATRR